MKTTYTVYVGKVPSGTVLAHTQQEADKWARIMFPGYSVEAIATADPFTKRQERPA